MINFHSLSFELTEGLVAKATGIPIEGVRWFKKHPFEVDLNQYLLPGHESLDWRKWIHLNKVREEWRDVLSIIQCYVTYEGMFTTVYKYHLRFILHVARKSKLYFPYCLSKSLSKMETKFKNHLEHTSHSIFHDGLVKLLVLIELRKHDCSWKHFLF